MARRLATRKGLGLPYLDEEAVSFAQRAAGEPHVWPRSWIVSGRALDHETTVTRLAAWRNAIHAAGEHRCGVAIDYMPDGSEVVAAVAVDALADLAPLPTRAHAGEWLGLDATLLVDARDARVVVTSPGGDPHTVPTSLRRQACSRALRPGATR